MPAVDNFITNVEKETKTSKAGRPFTIWYITLDDGRRIKFGFNKPPYEVGQRLTGTAEPNKFGDLEYSGPGAAPATGGSAGPHTPAPVATGGRTFPVTSTSPEMSIIRQNSLTNANAAVENWLSHGLGCLDECTTAELYAEAVIEIAYKFAEFSSGQREAKRVKAMTE